MTMLTLSETRAAIRNLNTEEDIIRRACFEISRPNIDPDDPADPQAIAKVMLHELGHRWTPAKTMIGAAMFLGLMAGGYCTAGEESALLKAIYEQIVDVFADVRAKKFHREAKTDPTTAIKGLFAMLGIEAEIVEDKEEK